MKYLILITSFAFVALFSAAVLPVSAQDAVKKETLQAGEFSFKYAKPWIRQQVTSSMRAGQLTYDHASEDLKDVELVIYYFGQGQGGGIDANIQRWIGQFQGTPEKKIEKKTLGDREVTFLKASGTYMESSGGPISGNKTERPGYTMLAAILPSEKGAVFLKLTGPDKSVEAMKDAFNEFAASPFEK